MFSSFSWSKKVLQVKKMLNHTVVICLLTLVSVGSIFLFKGMDWSDKHDLVLCREVLVMEPYQHPHRSKERGDVWHQVTVNLSDLDHPKFKVNKRSIRGRLTMTFLITMHKAKIRQEKNATGITWEETELNQTLEEIIDRRSLRKKGRRSSSRGTQATCYRTCRADREKTYWTLRSFAFPLFQWETRCRKQARA